VCARTRRLSRERHARSRRPQQPARDDAEHQRPGCAARDRRREDPLAQDYIPRLIDERLRSFEMGMAGQQKALDQILLLIDQGRSNPDSSPIVREYRDWRSGVEKRLGETQMHLEEFQTRADRQDGVLTGLKFLGVGGLLTALATLPPSSSASSRCRARSSNSPRFAAGG
jgi:hypothetical protein